jgi:four helix bundle protein
MELFEVSKSFPKEECYSLTDQIRRSSRSVCANMAEAYRKRRYPKNFISKLSDCDAENHGLVRICFIRKYITNETYDSLVAKNAETGRLIQFTLQHPEKFGSN